MRRNLGQFPPGVSGSYGGPRKMLPANGLQTITALATKGVREKDIARAVGMSVPTWIKYKADFPEALAALEDGQQAMHDALIGKLFEKAMGGDIVALLFTLKSRFAYREGDEPSEVRPQVIINLPGATSVQQYAHGITIEPDQDHIDSALTEVARHG